MEFYLTYRGELKSNGNLKHKHAIRSAFHRQLSELWLQKPLLELKAKLLSERYSENCLRPVGGFVFAPLVQEKINLVAEVHITLLRPEEPGRIVTQTGDVDNRLKTLFDALRMPQKISELPKGATPSSNESPFFCLLEDDNLITGLSVTTDRLLDNVSTTSEVSVLLHVRTKVTEATMLNIGLGV